MKMARQDFEIYMPNLMLDSTGQIILVSFSFLTKLFSKLKNITFFKRSAKVH